MARQRRYKRAEKNAVRTIFGVLKTFFGHIGKAIATVYKSGSRKLTVMVVPHSKSKVINFQTNMFALILVFVVISGVIISFVVFSKKTVRSDIELAKVKQESADARASLDELRDENNNLLQSAKRFQSAMSTTLSYLGMDKQVNSVKKSANNDLSSLYDVDNIDSSSVSEVSDVRKLANYLDDTVESVEEIGKLLQSQDMLFSDIPSLWPIRGGIGHVSFPFGQNRHPITGQWYIHTGMDFSTYRQGDPLIATANGQVVTVARDSGWGNYVIIKHKHGFFTRYAHMSRFRVQKGQYVSQGDVIGYIGNTGISTGPHVHYEVHIGSDVVDPAKYLSVK